MRRYTVIRIVDHGTRSDANARLRLSTSTRSDDHLTLIKDGRAEIVLQLELLQPESVNLVSLELEELRTMTAKE